MSKSYPDLSEMIANASELMEQQGITEGKLPAEVVVLATNKPKDVRNATSDGIINGFRSEVLKDPDSPSEVDIKTEFEHRTARTIDRMAYNMAKPARRRIMLGGVGAGVAMSALFLTGIGSVKYDLDQKLEGIDHSTDQSFLLDKNVLVYDSSIMSGDTGEDIPILGPVLHIIPGVPDFADFKLRTRTYTEQVVMDEQVSAESSYTAGASQNPLAPDLKLTGAEYQQGREAAAKLFDELGPAPKIDYVGVTGTASDDFNGKVGEIDPAQYQLGKDRGEIAKQAFMDEAASRDIAVTHEPVALGKEVVLDIPSVEMITNLAEENGFTVETLIKAYNENQALPQHVKEVLDESLGKNRGASFQVSGTKQVTRPIERTESVPGDDKTETKQDSVPGEAVVVLPMLAGTMYGLVFSVTHHGRYVRRKARKIAKKAGLSI